MDAPVRSVDEACAFVDELGASATGEVVVGGGAGPMGTVFVEGGRVCWAAARGLARRLSELLAGRSGLSPSEMEVVYSRCKARRVPLGEHLVESGVLAASELRTALLQHTAESLLVLTEAGGRATFRPREGGYSPRFTFATGEVLSRACAAQHAAIAASAEVALAAAFQGDDWAAAFVRSDSSALPAPIAIFGAAPSTSTALLRAGRWAVSALDVAATFCEAATFLCVDHRSRGRESSFVAFRDRGAVFAGETTTLGTARIMNRRAAERRSNGSKGGP